MANNPNIFLSYCWDNVDVANEIDNSFKNIGINLRRDVRDATYRKSLKEFMRQIGQSDFILLIISDEYLRSENCMYEATELLYTIEFEKRVLPIIMGDAIKIFKVSNQVKYYEYWESKVNEAEKIKGKHLNDVTIEYTEKIKNIANFLPGFFQKITDINVSTIEKLRKKNYRDILNIIGFDERLFDEIIAVSKIENKELRETKFNRFRKRYPNEIAALHLQARLAVRQKNYVKAKDIFEAILKLEPYNLATYSELGLLLENDFSDYVEAKNLYEIAIKIDPNYAPAYLNLASLLQNKFADYLDAKNLYERAIQIQPDNSIAYTNLGSILQYNFSNYEEAKKLYEKAIAISPNLAAAHFNLAQLLQENFSDFDAARKHYEEAVRIDPQFAVLSENFRSDKIPDDAQTISLYFLEDEYDAKEISEILSFLSDIYNTITDDELVIKGTDILEYEEIFEPHIL